MNLLTITESASNRMAELLKEEGQTDHTKVRVFVQGGGCSGFSYGFTFDDVINEDDFVVDIGRWKILVDSMTSDVLLKLTGSPDGFDMAEDILRNHYIMEVIQTNSKTAENTNSAITARLINTNTIETAHQRTILFEAFVEFFPSS